MSERGKVHATAPLCPGIPLLREHCVQRHVGPCGGEPGGSRLGARQLTAEEFPRTFELRPHLEGVDRDAEFDFGLDLVLSGLKARL